MSYQDKIIYGIQSISEARDTSELYSTQMILKSGENSLSIINDKEYIIYKNNFEGLQKYKELKNKIEELNSKIDFINNYKINLDKIVENNILDSISILENTITLINRFIINKGNIR